MPSGFAATGGPIEFDTAEISYFEGNLLARHVVVLDLLGLARQFGAVLSDGQPNASSSKSA